MNLDAQHARKQNDALPIGRDFHLSNGLRLAADIAGQDKSPTVLFLHGGGQTRGSWRGAVTRFADEGYRAVALDLRGHGDSEWAPDGDYSLSLAAEDIRQVAEQLGGPMIAVGASFGGLVSMLAFGEAPRSELAALVLVDVVPKLNLDGAMRVRAFMESGSDGFASLEEAADAVASYLPERPRRANPQGLARSLRPGSGGRLYWHWDPAFLNAFSDGERIEREERIARAVIGIEAPILLVRGGTSDVVAKAEVAAFHALVPRAEVVDIKGAGHMVAGDSNSAFMDRVLEFVHTVAPLP